MPIDFVSAKSNHWLGASSAAAHHSRRGRGDGCGRFTTREVGRSESKKQRGEGGCGDGEQQDARVEAHLTQPREGQGIELQQRSNAPPRQGDSEER